MCYNLGMYSVLNPLRKEHFSGQENTFKEVYNDHLSLSTRILCLHNNQEYITKGHRITKFQ